MHSIRSKAIIALADQSVCRTYFFTAVADSCLSLSDEGIAISPDMEIQVVASVIEKDGKVLICERPSHKRHGGLWEFPGGKVEAGETDFEAVSRELEEELGVEVIAVGGVEFSVADPGSQFVIHFLPVEIDGDPQAIEHTRIAWVRVEELLTLQLAPSDLKYAHFRARTFQREAVE